MGIIYDQLLHYLNKQAEETSEAVIVELAIHERKKAVDIGCGGGCYALKFAQMNPLSQVFALDIDKRQLDFVKKQADKKNLKNLFPVWVLPRQIMASFEKQTINLFFLRNVFHDIPEPIAYFSYIKQYLNYHGQVAIVEFLPNKRFVEGRTGIVQQNTIFNR